MLARKQINLWIGLAMLALTLTLGIGLIASTASAGVPTGNTTLTLGVQGSAIGGNAGNAGNTAGSAGSANPGSGPLETPTPVCTPDSYTIITGTATIVSGTVDVGNHCDDCTTVITMPFAYQLYDQSYTSVNVDSNGTLQFGSGFSDYNSTCLPGVNFVYTILPHWDDLMTTPQSAGAGIFTSVSGSQPNRIFNIEWRACYYNTSGSCTSAPVNFEVRLYEGQSKFDLVYGTIPQGGSSATVGVQLDTSVYTQYECNTGGLSAGLAVTFNRVQGSCPTSTPANTPTATATPICPGAWTQQAPYPIPIGFNGVTEHNGLIYSFGGSSNGSVIANAYKYDPAANAWSTIAPLPRIAQEPNAVSDGTNIYIVRGGLYPSPNLYRYDPAANTYMTMTSYTVPTWGQVSAYLNGKVYKIAGALNGNQTVYTNTVEIYDIASDSWSRGAPYPLLTNWMAAVSTGGYFYVMGGRDIGAWTDKTYRYDPVTNTWDDLAMADLPIARTFSSAGVLPDGRIIMAGGSLGNFQITNTAIIWDPGTNTWSRIDSMLEARYAMDGAVAGNAFYNIGGYDANSGYTGHTDNQRYIDNCLALTGTPTATITNTPVPPTATACTITFTDVPVGSTFYAFIRCLACRGIINGYPCGGTGEPCNPNNDPYFRPSSNLTRGQLAKIVANAAGLNDPVSGQSFEDVLPGTAFYTYTERLYAIGAIGGYQCGIDPGEPCGPGNRPYYRPGAGITRGQLTKIVSNAAGFNDPAPTTFTFTDVPVGSTFHIYVERLLLNRPGVMGGYPCGGPGEPCDPQNRPYFRPGANLTRGQASKIVGNTFYPDCNTPSRSKK